jgi:hypothetical protein
MNTTPSFGLKPSNKFIANAKQPEEQIPVAKKLTPLQTQRMKEQTQLQNQKDVTPRQRTRQMDSEDFY